MRTVQNLTSQAGMAVGLGVGLPAVYVPRFDFQLVSGEPLNAYAVEEPRRVRRHVRRLISPIVKMVVTEQANVGHENSSVDVQPVLNIKVVTAVGFRDVAVSVAKIPLANAGTGVITRRGSCK